MAHAALTRQYVTVELEDGTIHEDLRVVFKDIAAYMKAARINKWDTDDALIQRVFCTWHAGKRLGHWDATYELFRDILLVDFDIADVATDEDKTKDPTPAS